ncbi:MAG: outer membrane protein transport protein [Nitrospinae bacterium]|nr:outer membrane protein transport protein [Nitrospinota bacterium]
MKRVLGFLAIALLFVAQNAWATNGHQLIAVGSYGEGMAGAVTAAPFDTTTAISNPAGLTKLGARADFHFQQLMPKRSVDWTALGGTKTEGGSDKYLIPSVGWSAPINDDETLFFGGGMFVTSGMGVDYDSVNAGFLQINSTGTVPGPMMKGRVYSQYQFWKMAPTLAKKFSDKLSVGLALNVDYQQLSLKQWFYNTDTTTYPSPYLSSMGIDLSTPMGVMGYGFTIGALYDVNDMISIGVNYSSKQSFDKMQFRLQKGNVTYAPTGTGTLFVSRDGTYSLGMDFPSQYAFGVAVRPSEAWLVTLDYKKINFSETLDSLSLEGTYDTTSLTTGATSTASAMPLAFKWKDVNVYALGIQYKLGDGGWLRAGYNSGDSPIDSSNASSAWALPAITKNHYSFGGTGNIGKHWQGHFAYQIANEETVASANGDKISLKGTSVTVGLSYLFR